MKSKIHSEIFELQPSTLVSLFQLNLKDIGKAYLFHAGENEYTEDIVYGGKTYYYLPISMHGFDYSTDAMPRPKLIFDNTDAYMSLKTRYFENFIGYQIFRKRTFVKYLDDVNFPNNTNPYGAADSTAHFPEEKFLINKKVTENHNVVEFELSSPLEQEEAEIPNRKIVYNVCQWTYRSPIGCGYVGDPVADSKDNLLVTASAATPIEYDSSKTYNAGEWVKISPSSSEDSNVAPVRYFVCQDNGTKTNPLIDRSGWKSDECSKSISGCRFRFGLTESDKGLPFGGFPGTEKH